MDDDYMGFKRFSSPGVEFTPEQRQIIMDASRPKLSVVFGTYNRLDALKRCIPSVYAATAGMRRGDVEVIIVDGGSTDGTLGFVRSNAGNWLKPIEQGELRGAVAAYNEGFAIATGDYVAYLNDDLILQHGQLAAACKMLDDNPGIGIVALQYANPGSAPAFGGQCTVRDARYPFASFGVVRRELGERVGWFDGFWHYYGDCYLCAKIQMSGYLYAELKGYTAEHMNLENALRGDNRWKIDDAKSKARADGKRWAEMWKEG